MAMTDEKNVKDNATVDDISVGKGPVADATTAEVSKTEDVVSGSSLVTDVPPEGGVSGAWKAVADGTADESLLETGDKDEPAIRYEHVSKVYDKDIVAVNDLSAEIGHREFVMLVGSSGGGKTTLLKMANGLIRPTSGAIYYYGDDIAHMDRVNLRRKIGYAIQGSVLFPHMNVRKNIEYVPRLRKFDKDQMADAVDTAMRLVGLDNSLLEKIPSELSGGQQQRVGIARAIAAQPYVLLMDEPFGAVDAITRHSLQETMARIHKEAKLTILFVTHDINEALRLGTRLLVINDGIMQQYDTPDELLAHPATPYVEALLGDR